MAQGLRQVAIVKPSVALLFLTRLTWSSHPGRLSESLALGPPSLGAVTVHTTPIAVPDSETIGEPDISLRERSAAWVIHSGPPT